MPHCLLREMVFSGVFPAIFNDCRVSEIIDPRREASCSLPILERLNVTVPIDMYTLRPSGFSLHIKKPSSYSQCPSACLSNRVLCSADTDTDYPVEHRPSSKKHKTLFHLTRPPHPADKPLLRRLRPRKNLPQRSQALLVLSPSMRRPPRSSRS